MFSGGYVGGVTPVPIPNTEVKPSRADGTPRETAWESRSLPDFFEGPESSRKCGFGAFAFAGCSRLGTLLLACEASGLTQREFAERRSMTLSTLPSWCTATGASRERPPAQPVRLQPVQVMMATASVVGNSLEVLLCSGERVRFVVGTDVEYVVRRWPRWGANRADAAGFGADSAGHAAGGHAQQH